MINNIFDNRPGFHEFILLAENIEEADLRAIQSILSEASLAPSLGYILSSWDNLRPSFTKKTDQPVLFYKNVRSMPVGRNTTTLSVPIGTIADPTAFALEEIVKIACKAQFFAALQTREQLD